MNEPRNSNFKWLRVETLIFVHIEKPVLAFQLLSNTIFEQNNFKKKSGTPKLLEKKGQDQARKLKPDDDHVEQTLVEKKRNTYRERPTEISQNYGCKSNLNKKSISGTRRTTCVLLRQASQHFLFWELNLAINQHDFVFGFMPCQHSMCT